METNAYILENAVCGCILRIRRFWRYHLYIRIADDREYDNGNFPKADIFYRCFGTFIYLIFH